MPRAGAHAGPSAVLLVEGIPAPELTKPELVMRMLLRQAGPLKAYAFFPGPAAATAAEFDRPDIAKQVMRQLHGMEPSVHVWQDALAGRCTMRPQAGKSDNICQTKSHCLL